MKKHIRQTDSVEEADMYAQSQGWEIISKDFNYRCYKDNESGFYVRVRFVRNGPPETSYSKI